MRGYWADALSSWLAGFGIPEGIALALAYIVGGLVLLVFAPVLALVLIWITRKVISRIQDRIGPNRVGPYGLLQTVADALKLLSKEDIMPANADWTTYNLAPILSVFSVLMIVAVVPFGPGLIGVDLNVGVLYVVALGSVGIMAAIMAGWASNNKYALLAGFRVVAQLISYEVPMVLAIVTVVLLTGTMRFGELAARQSLEIFGFNLGLGWYGILMPGALLVFFISALAEAEQTPFDLLEAESELIAGFHIEYSGMKFAMFFLAQFLNSWFLGAVMATLFLGGWQGPFVDQLPILGVVYFFIKAFAIYLLQQWIKGTYPRIRIDQMNHLAWKVLVPLMVVLITLQAIIQKLPVGTPVQYILIFLANVGVVVVVLQAMSNYYKREQVRSKRAFEPRGLVGTMVPAEKGVMY